MSLPTLDEVVVDQRGTWLTRAMQGCPVCDLPPDYHERIAEARRRAWGATKIRAYLAAAGAPVTYRAVKSHVVSHMDEEFQCLRSDRRPSTSSSKPATKAKRNSSARS